MPRISLSLVLSAVAAVAILGGSALLVPALSGDVGGWLPSDGGSVVPVASRADPEAVARRAWDAKGGELAAALEDYAADSPDFAVSLIDNRTGWTFDYSGDRTFETASVVKVGILAAALLRAQDEERELTDRELRLARQMIGVSDNDAATSLYQLIGQATGLRAADRELGLEDTTPNASWGLTTTTPNDQARLVSALLVPDDDGESLFTDYSRATAEELMSSVDQDQVWGISAAADEGERAALKNGWLSRDTENDTWIVNSVGRITGDDVDMSLVVLSHGNAGFRRGVDHVEKVAAMTREQLGL